VKLVVCLLLVSTLSKDNKIMAFDKNFYIDKKKKIEDKISKEKDEFLVEIANEIMRLAGRVQKFSQDQVEKNEEYQEVVKIIEENKKLEENDGKGGKK
jgi:hypothetical protein